MNYLLINPFYTFIQKTFLPRPVKAFGTRECVDTQSNTFKNPLEFYDHYSLHACMLECRAKFTYEKCNCSGPFDAGKSRVENRIIMKSHFHRHIFFIDP